ncbi:hypothetical protein E2C01_070411 [Portunus trituberculatus]|uniref:Uncharacterized protein n=1 Tax=Portunus trituberculatus TaxID=210409 RepID=A0A5B7HU27_PORTR|nr:hypothetical protein [Portunus trituberculatus]
MVRERKEERKEGRRRNERVSRVVKEWREGGREGGRVGSNRLDSFPLICLRFCATQRLITAWPSRGHPPLLHRRDIAQESPCSSLPVSLHSRSAKLQQQTCGDWASCCINYRQLSLAATAKRLPVRPHHRCHAACLLSPRLASSAAGILHHARPVRSG